MKLYENQSCPVCKRQFEETDDIVVCPECGTPHHRECYNMIGRCVNQGLHKTNYSYNEEHPRQQPENSTEKQNDAAESTARTRLFPPVAEGEAKGSAYDFTRTPYDADTSTICGESIADVATAVRSNTNRFVNIFKHQESSGRKAGWNWGAFFFGAYYLFFRKMYKQAVTLFCVNLTLSSVLTLLVTKLAPLTNQAISELATAGEDVNLIMEKINGLQSVSDFDTFFKLYLAFTAISLTIRICVAVFADSMYKSTVVELIKTVNKQLKEGASFDTPAFPFREEEVSFSQEQLRRLYIAKRGGVSLWAPCIAYMLTYIISIIM